MGAGVPVAEPRGVPISCAAISHVFQIDLKLVLTDSHNTPARTKIVAKYLYYVNRTDIPIGTGCFIANCPCSLSDNALQEYGKTTSQAPVRLIRFVALIV